MIHADPPPPTPPSYERLNLVVELGDPGDSSLLRVFSTLHRRRCRVTQVAFQAGEQLELCVDAPPRHAGSVARWLGALVDVRSARVTSAP